MDETRNQSSSSAQGGTWSILLKGAAVVTLSLVMVLPASAAVRDATDSEIALIRSAMQRRLKDADSAKFIDVKVDEAADGGMHQACGMVNSKNAFGAYAGFSKFLAALATNEDGKDVAVVIGIDDDMPIAAGMCAERGM